MIFAKRIAVLVIAAVVLILIFRLPSRKYHHALQDLSQTVGLGDLVEDEDDSGHAIKNSGSSIEPSDGSFTKTPSQLPPGSLKPPGDTYTRGLVIGRLTSENTTWLDGYLPTDPDLQLYLYLVDDKTAPLHTPVNKGHEAMVYLTYIIDHYDDLPDVTIFMHPHQIAWHTPELLNHDATEVLKRLSSERVIREGYTNLRCYWDPGCPERLYPGQTYRDSSKREELATAAAWAEMFPDDPIPQALGAPCCAQFAVAKHRIQSIPKAHFERYRDWLIRTKESDWISGRVFEYLWQKIFANKAILCPDARVCYCDGYGICFVSGEQFEEWFDNHHWWREGMKELKTWEEQALVIDGIHKWKDVEQKKLDIPIAGRNLELKKEIDERFQKLVQMRTEALQRGTDPAVRALVAGRSWSPGDGY